MKINHVLLGFFLVFFFLRVSASDDYYNEIKKDAAAGNAHSQFKLGRMYMILSGDYDKAAIWIGKSARQGYPEAQADMGSLYYYGQGVKKNIKKAEEWFIKASNNGNPRAQNDLAMIYKISGSKSNSFDCDKILSLLNKSAEKDYDLAYLNMGDLYSEGNCLNRNMSKAVDWWEKAATKGNAQAEFNLYISYNNGEGVYENQYTAGVYLRKSCDHGYTKACDIINH
ncbi:tetratricopeptide repeat protein [Klebsiella sp. BIGb0407]|uniref:tetratricopeptide repeat protein n=1 Tax=Klebsiella sp. BIGb0407 TaxID=2940603 RepID=UPI002167B6BC|nr:tetratricopeptide repeat protein [Klebsiella sp. BIGb0407]MCS3434244.1 TPR repeat protein [Klebsiella sp. BIGb0407]